MSSSWGNIAKVHNIDKLKDWDSWPYGSFRNEAIKYNGNPRSKKKPVLRTYRVQFIKVEYTHEPDKVEIAALNYNDAVNKAATLARMKNDPDKNVFYNTIVELVR